MQIDIVSDVVCPWCYIGKRRIERAIAIGAGPAPVIRWRPFQLNPDIPAEGLEREAYLALKFGGAANARQVYADITRAGAAEGLAFAFDRIARTPNTLDAHRLIRLAEGHGCQDAVVEGLFRRYFIDGIDIGDPEHLSAVAVEAGLDGEAVADYLASARDVEAVRAEDLKARRLGITGVPCFIVDGRYAVSGAQAPEVFLRVFEAAREPAAG